jgi:phosphatidylserine/phosphatidylglycerophosphate/cardiolipin synthase-like enzyme
VVAWADVLATIAGPDDATEAALIDARPGYPAAALASRLVAVWRADAPDLTGAAVALALRSAAELHHEAESHRTKLAVSGPTSDSVPVRLTSSVVIDVIRAARQSLLVVSFAAYGVAEVVDELVAATDRGVHIDLVLESSVQAGGTLRGGTDGSAVFTQLRNRATFWHWPAHRRPAAGSSRAALHAKLIAADTRVALVSSANLTDRALSRNLEVGVVLYDPQVVERLVQHFVALMNMQIGPLEPVSFAV